MSLGRLAGGALVATGLAATMCVGTYWTASAMQSDLADQARTTLAAQHLNATVTFAGRDAYVWADSPTARADAIAVLRTIPGVRIVLVGTGTGPVAPSPSPSLTATSVGPSVTATRTSPPPSSAPPSSTPAPTDGASTASTPPSPTATIASTSGPATAVATASASASTTTPPVTVPAWPAILFDGDSSTVTKASRTQLAQIAGFMVAHPTMTAHLTGYTDTSGTSAGRQALGLARANAVEAVLVAGGVSAAHITVASRGGNDPVATSATSQGRALNRRVTVTMTQES
jgi:outer membrane protein OmpA-like peptidoglycan-associated protein